MRAWEWTERSVPFFNILLKRGGSTENKKAPNRFGGCSRVQVISKAYYLRRPRYTSKAPAISATALPAEAALISGATGSATAKAEAPTASNPATPSADRRRAGTGVTLSTAIASMPPAANCHDEAFDVLKETVYPDIRRAFRQRMGES